MPADLDNVKADLRDQVARDALAKELAGALSGMFTIEYHRRFRLSDVQYTSLHCKATRSIAESLLLEREILALIANFDDAQVRTIHIVQELIAKSKGRLDPALAIVVHADRRGDQKLRTWAREQGLKVIPIFRPRASALPTAEVMRRNLAKELFALDPFEVTGPVVNDMDFYGRGNDALELTRQLQVGRIRALFAIRKAGKTSLINRVVGLARESGALRIAMIDCSNDDFNRLSAEEALRAVAKVAKLAAHRGYGHIADALRRTDEELAPVFEDLWSQEKGYSLALIFDEVDYITPASPTRVHWKGGFNVFWRELRGVCQESQRQGAPLAVLVSGVSSQFFRVESIESVENAVLHFVPEDYLPPFAREASSAMLKDLGRRCGLQFESLERELIAKTCGDFPFWIRRAGSFIHRSVEIEGRPLQLERGRVEELLAEFVDTDGVDLCLVALEDLGRKYPVLISLLERVVAGDAVSASEGRVLARYGLAQVRSGTVAVESQVVREAVIRLKRRRDGLSLVEGATTAPALGLELSTDEWAEELAVLNRRRNLLERSLRELVRAALKVTLAGAETWSERLLKAFPEKRREALSQLKGNALLSGLYWKELETVIVKNWSVFERTFGDKKRFSLAMTLLNERPDAHAKSVDAADLAMYRRELGWLEDRTA